MIVKTSLKKSGTILTAICTLCLCGAVIVCSKSCSEGAFKGIEMCIKVLIPSLFPFMCISSFIVKSGISGTIGKPFGFLTRKIFGLDGCFSPVLLLSIIGGYPVGAKGISAIHKSGIADTIQCRKAVMFAVCAGPGFTLNFIGSSLYSNSTIGFIILVSQILSVLIIGITINILGKTKSNFVSNTELSTKEAQQNIPIGNAIVEATAEGVKGIMNICAFVVLFSAITGMIGNIIGNGLFKNSVFILLEVCSAVNNLVDICPVEVIAFATGFGGLCVHFQIFSAIGDLKINKFLFFCIRIFQGAITGILTHFGLMMFSDEQMVFSTATVENTATSGDTVASAIALIGVSLCFLYTIKYYKSS